MNLPKDIITIAKEEKRNHHFRTVYLDYSPSEDSFYISKDEHVKTRCSDINDAIKEYNLFIELG